MYLAAYHFDGDPTELAAAHDRMMSDFPPDTVLFHALAVGATGVTVIDACPDKATHEQFAVNPEFHGALAKAGLPMPRIEVLGDVARAYAHPSAVTLVGETVPS